MLGTPLSIMPLKATVSANRTGVPLTMRFRPPNGCRFSPVAVTMMSAGRSAPDFSWMPDSVNVAMWSVTTEASPRLIAVNRLPSGTARSRCSHGA